VHSIIRDFSPTWQPVFEIGEGLRIVSFPDPFVTRSFHDAIRQMANHVDSTLLQRTVPPKYDVKPQWDKGTGRLMFEGQLARQIAPQARTLIPILDTFEELNWLERIDSPISGLTRAGSKKTVDREDVLEEGRRHGAINTLNDGLHFIQFAADGTGEGIRWEIVD